MPDYGLQERGLEIAYMPEIKILSGLEAVRLRPAMYIGSTGPRGVAHMLWEIVGNAIDEHLAGHASRVDVYHGVDGSWRVSDDGRGLPVDTNPDIMQRVFGELHAGATLDDHLPHIHVGDFGVGAAAVCGLSSWMRVEIRRAGKIWQQMYVQGRPVGELTVLGECSDTGTVVHYQPDLLIFNEERCSVRDVTPRLRELAALAPKLMLTLQGEDLSAPGGLTDFVEAISGSNTTFRAQGRHFDIDVDIAVSWSSIAVSTDRLFVNYVDMRDTTRKMPLMLKTTFGEGRHAAISLLMQHPRFAGPTRQRLENPEALTAIRRVIKEHLPAFLEKHPELALKTSTPSGSHVG